ncbi:MAG TPA: hypothetical protein VK641_08610 [Terriglobales bacterium]|nr:hypothetical protein [Terriglobales bacterium]
MNAALKTRLAVSAAPATQTQHRQVENHLQIPHKATRSSSLVAWLFLNARMRAVPFDRTGPQAGTFTQPLQNEESLPPFERDKGIHRQRLDPVLRPSEMAGAVKVNGVTPYLPQPRPGTDRMKNPFRFPNAKRRSPSVT